MTKGTYFSEFINLEFERIQEFFRYRKLEEYLKSNNMSLMNILEIGPGFNSVAQMVSENQRITILEPGIELYNRNLLELSKLEDKSKVTLLNVDLEEFIASSKNLPKNLNFDCVILSSVIHEIENFDTLFIELLQITSRNCVFYIIVNNKNSIHRLIGRELNIIKSLDEITLTELRMGQSKAVSLNEMKTYLNSYGIEIIRYETFFPKLLSHSKMFRLFESNRIDFEFLQKLYLISNELPDFGSEIIIEAYST